MTSPNLFEVLRAILPNSVGHVLEGASLQRLAIAFLGIGFERANSHGPRFAKAAKRRDGKRLTHKALIAKA